MRTAVVFILLTTAFQTLRAQAPQAQPPRAQPPTIKVDGKESNLVFLQQLDVQVRIYGTVATTTWTMTFKNSTGRILEGELNFPLAEDITVNRYALDINGRLREAVPVEKEKATQVFESIERRRVDPGLLEKVQGNGFRTRIYPIPANGARIVQIGYEEELQPGKTPALRWRLPLAFRQPLDVFNLDIQIFRGTVRPEIESNIDSAFQFRSWQNNWTASHRWEHFKADRTLTIAIPRAPDEQDVLMQQTGNHYTYLLNVTPSLKNLPKSHPRSITILWDASLSGLTRDHEKELRLLGAYLAELREVDINLVPFRHIAGTPIHFDVHGGRWEALRDTLAHMVYDGGTQLGGLNPGQYHSDEYLLFSDGKGNYGSDRMAPVPRPLYAIVATANADHPYLREIAEGAGGELINLETGGVEQGMTQLLYQRLYFMGVKSDPDLESSYPSRTMPVTDGFSVAGICYKPTHEIVLQFGNGRTVISEIKVALDFTKQATETLDLTRVWAQKKLAQLDMRYEDNKLEIQALGRRYGLVTRNTSLIVLETVQDYVTYNIEPPAELREEYDKIIKQRGQMIRQQQEAIRDKAGDMFDELLSWWKMDFKPRKWVAPPKEKADTIRVQALQGRAPGLEVRRDRSLPAPPANAERTLDEVVVVGYATQKKSSVTGTVTRVEAEDGLTGHPQDEPRDEHASNGSFHAFKQEVQTAYLEKLRKAHAGDRYAVYLQERKAQLYTPVFYYNTATFFFEKGEKGLGLQILSNIAELEVESYELYKMLGYELRRLGEKEAACEAFRKVLEWRPFEPQSYRDYSMALRDAGHYQQALDTLYTALVKNYDADIDAQYPGIEEVIVPEINNLIALKGDKVDFGRIPRRLIQNMPVDIRVVLNWNMNDTDMDLWVTDPNGEKCYYSHKKTEAGGRISSDFTRGLGPEQFMLKKAITGKYKVEVNYYGDTQAKLAGPTTLLVEIYTRYGTDHETRTLIPLQMQAVSERTVLVGEFDFR